MSACAVACAVVVVLAGCSPATTGTTTEGTADGDLALRAFDDCEALTLELRRRGLAQVARGADGGVLRSGDAAVAAEAQDVAPVAGGAAEWSGTNVQVAGVDEPDVVKTDGSHLYTLADGELRVVDVREAHPRVVSTLTFDGGVPRDLLLHEGRLLILGDDAPNPGRVPDPLASDELDVALSMAVPRTRLWSVDVSDPVAPAVTSTMAVDGGLLTARLTDGTARVVIRSLPVLPDVLRSSGAAPDPAGVRRGLRDATADAWLPQVSVDGGEAAPLVGCMAVRAPAGGDDLGLVSVLSLDLDRAGLDADRVDAVLGAADTVYADADSLYVTTSRWPIAVPLEPLPLEDPAVGAERLPVEPVPLPDQPAPVPSASAPPPVPGASAPPSDDTTPAATDRGVAPSPPAVTTEVHQFDLGRDGATYLASGSVPGTVLNQWALSEHDDHLRIATTVDDGTRRRSHSAVHVLRRDDAQLTEVGRTGDLGRGERIYAVRYAGALGFVVTFRQVDPLYTLDLSDPAAPSVLGELKIPGYSAYLHPVGDDHLLGVGQDADTDGTVKGLQISLFDVSDLRAPARVGQIGFGPQTSSPVEYDHRALLAWPDRDLIAVPVERWDDGGTGVLVLRATDDGRLVERGTIDLGTTMPGGPVRAVVVGDRLLTVSPDLITASDVDTLTSLGALRL